MSETKFMIRYTVKPEQRENYLKIIREFKSIIVADGLTDYSVFADKRNNNKFTEIFTFDSETSYDNYDDEADERVNILMSKMAEIIVEKSTSYSVITKVENPIIEEV